MNKLSTLIIPPVDFCDKCQYPVKHCECAAIEARKVVEAEAQKKRDIERLGGLRASDMFNLSNFNNPIKDKLSAIFPQKSLYLYGGVGTGKTHIATALVRNEPSALVLKPQSLFRRFQGKVDVREFEAGIKQYVNLPMLVIDDIATQKNTDHSFSVLYEIIDGRWMNNPGGLILTSNVDLDGLAKSMQDDRIASRIAGMCAIIKMSGEDKRSSK
jgi:DNA replication protein DnaC